MSDADIALITKLINTEKYSVPHFTLACQLTSNSSINPVSTDNFHYKLLCRNKPE